MSTDKAFINSKEEFDRNKLLELPEVFVALCDSNVENIFVKDTRLLFTDFPIAVTLKEFETIQLKNIFEVIFFVIIYKICITYLNKCIVFRLLIFLRTIGQKKLLSNAIQL